MRTASAPCTVLEAGVENVVVLMDRVRELEGLHGVEAPAVDSPRLSVLKAPGARVKKARPTYATARAI